MKADEVKNLEIKVDIAKRQVLLTGITGGESTAYLFTEHVVNDFVDKLKKSGWFVKKPVSQEEINKAMASHSSYEDNHE